MPKKTILVIKKYANRRLYNTETSRYITLDDLYGLVKAEREFKVIDAKTHSDLTRLTLAQVILDYELKGFDLLPVEALKEIIKFYGHPLSKNFNIYLTNSIALFNQQIDQMSSLFGRRGEPLNHNSWKKMLNSFASQNQKYLQEIFKVFGSKE